MNRIGLWATMMLMAGSSAAAPADKDVPRIVGSSTNNQMMRFGPSANDLPGTLAGYPGLSTFWLGLDHFVAAKNLYEDFSKHTDRNGIATIGGDPASKLGAWSLGRVRGRDGNEVYFGVWQGPQPTTGNPVTNVAYIVGGLATPNLDQLKGNLYIYATQGVGRDGEYFTGSLLAQFNKAGTGGILKGSIASDQRHIELDKNNHIAADATFAGTASGGDYAIRGRFFGAAGEALGGLATHKTDDGLNVGFAGTR